MPAEKFQLKQIPKKLLDDPFAETRAFSTVFLVNGQIAGSGTFVRMNGAAGILTAHHVWEYIVSSGDHEVGLQITNKRHRFVIPLKYLVAVYGMRGRSEAFGPDIVFIKIPQAFVGAIEAHKSFYNLDIKTAQRRAKARESYGLCIVTGAPATRATPSKVPGSSMTIFVLGSILGRTRIRWKGDFDYWELKTLSRKNGRPESFGGMSGAGVWKVILEKKRGAKLSTAKILGVYLSGVAYYQSALKGNWRFLRAHGPNTIYRKLRKLKMAISVSTEIADKC
jgi:hypothetical protein